MNTRVCDVLQNIFVSLSSDIRGDKDHELVASEKVWTTSVI